MYLPSTCHDILHIKHEPFINFLEYATTLAGTIDAMSLELQETHDLT